MSHYHANVLWQNDDGSWNIAIQKKLSTPNHIANNPNFDEEWDAEYSDEFDTVVLNKPTLKEAISHFGNFGSYNPVYRTEENIPYINKIEAEVDRARVSSMNGGTERIIGRRSDVKAPYHVALKNLSEIIAPDDYRRGEVTVKMNLEDNIQSFEVAANHPAITPSERAKLKEERKKLLDRFKNDPKVKSYMKEVFSGQRLKDFKGTLEKLQKTPITASKSSERSKLEREITKAAGPKHHVNPETGRTGQCKATKKPCPFGGGDEHYASADLARKAYEAKNQKSVLRSFNRRGY